MTLPAGSRLGPYEIVGAVGAGGMGEVYRARDTRLEREVAVKVLSRDLTSSEIARERFPCLPLIQYTRSCDPYTRRYAYEHRHR
jgi:serine/threonine protein kinase